MRPCVEKQKQTNKITGLESNRCLSHAYTHCVYLWCERTWVCLFSAACLCLSESSMRGMKTGKEGSGSTGMESGCAAWKNTSRTPHRGQAPPSSTGTEVS